MCGISYCIMEHLSVYMYIHIDYYRWIVNGRKTFLLFILQDTVYHRIHRIIEQASIYIISVYIYNAWIWWTYMMVKILMCFVLFCCWGGGGGRQYSYCYMWDIYRRLCPYRLVGLIRKTFGFCLGWSQFIIGVWVSHNAYRYMWLGQS